MLDKHTTIGWTTDSTNDIQGAHPTASHAGRSEPLREQLPVARWTQRRVLLLPGFDLFLFSNGELPGRWLIEPHGLGWVWYGMVVMMGVVPGWSC